MGHISSILDVWRFQVWLDPGLVKAWPSTVLASFHYVLHSLYWLFACGGSLQPHSLQLSVARHLPWKESTLFLVVPGNLLGMTLLELRPHALPWTNHWEHQGMTWVDGPGLDQLFSFGVRGEVSSSQPPKTERERIVSIEENQETALEKRGRDKLMAPASHARDPVHHILELVLTLESCFLPAWTQRESSVFLSHFIFLINLLPALPQEQLSNKNFFFSSERSWRKNQNTFACYLKHFKPVSYLCHCTVFSFQCWYFCNYNHLQPHQFLLEKVILNRGQKNHLETWPRSIFQLSFHPKVQRFLENHVSTEAAHKQLI